MSNTYAEIIKLNLEELLKSYISTGLIPAVSVTVANKDQILYSFSDGSELPFGKGKTINENTLFHIASVSKPITSMLLTKLMEMGLLTVTDPVKKFIPEFKYEETSIYNLLTHSGGYDENEAIQHPTGKQDKQRFYDDVYSAKLKYKIGEGSYYWTFYYSILCDIIERVTGMNLDVFADKYLFQPLEMHSTSYDFAKIENLDYVNTYSQQSNDIYTVYPKIPTGDGGIFTTSQQLSKIGQLFLNGGVYSKTGERVFSKSSIQYLSQECSNGKFNRTPAFWLKGKADNAGCFADLCSEHSLAHTGMSGCMLCIDPVNCITAVILTNSLAFHDDWKNYKKIFNAIMPLSDSF